MRGDFVSLICAPVLLTAYNRPSHFKSCIQSLQANPESRFSHLFVAIDAPFRDEDVAANNEIISCAKDIKGFKKIDLIIREKNFGAYKNALTAREEVFSRYSRMIRAEDDNVFSPYFLNYINNGLLLYEDDPKVFAICGYSEPLDLDKKIGSQVYLRRGFSSFGFGTWKDKFTQVDPLAETFYQEHLSPVSMSNFRRAVGDNIYIGLLVAKRLGRIYMDMSIVYHIFKNTMYSVHPAKSLVRNIGQDGSGLHSGINDEIQNQEIGMEPVVYDVFAGEGELSAIRDVLNRHFKAADSELLKYYLFYVFNYIKEQSVLNGASLKVS